MSGTNIARPSSSLSDRKSEHLDVVLRGDGRGSAASGFDAVTFEHLALPELDMDDVELSTEFVGRRINAPLLVSSMTGGPERAAAINRNLALAAGELGVALAVGSQRVAIEQGGAFGFGKELRRLAPNVPLLANFGAAQLNLGFGLDEARRAVEMIEADALIIHLNPLQEAVQPEGNRNWRGLLDRIAALARALDVPIVAKEVGSGISGAVARRLVDVGVRAIDVAGAGGTSWAIVEAERAPVHQAEVARAFAGWGIPTAAAVVDVRAACPQASIVASGGVRDGLDVARAIRLGADIAGQAAGVLPAAMVSAEAVVAHFRVVIEQLRIACFCTGSADLAALRHARLMSPPVEG